MESLQNTNENATSVVISTFIEANPAALSLLTTEEKLAFQELARKLLSALLQDESLSQRNLILKSPAALLQSILKYRKEPDRSVGSLLMELMTVIKEFEEQM